VLALDPLRLGLILLLITRPRPLQSLLGYWVGAMTASVPYMLVPLVVLHVTPAFRPFAQHIATATFTSASVRHTQIGIGVVTLLIAALMAVRFRASQRAYLSAPAGTTPTAVPDPNPPTAISQPLDHTHDAPTGRHRQFWAVVRNPVGSLGPVRVAWENGSSWVSVVIGLASGPPPLTVLLVLTTIVASGAAIGTQVSLALAWVVGMFALVEIILVSHIAAPAKTEALLRLLHDWLLAHRRQTLIAVIAVAGVVMMAYGMGAVQAGR
jgi:hypothetical protein